MATRSSTALGSANADFEEAFLGLKAMFEPYEASSVVLHDEPAKYYLGTKHLRPKDGYRMWFGGVEIKKNYVSAHVFPVYLFPDLLESVSAGLRKHMQGKSCFNFKKRDAALFEEFAALLARGAKRLESADPKTLW